MTDEERSRCFARLANVLVAFDATYVERFVDSIQQAEPADVDVAALLDIELEVRLLKRPLAILSTKNGSISLALGEHLHLESIAARSIQGLPPVRTEPRLGRRASGPGCAAPVSRS